MPIWITILMAIIGNIPTIIKAIQAILALLRNQPVPVQAQMKAEMKQAVKDCAVDGDHARLLVRLEGLMARLREPGFQGR